MAAVPTCPTMARMLKEHGLLLPTCCPGSAGLVGSTEALAGAAPPMPPSPGLHLPYANRAGHQQQQRSGWGLGSRLEALLKGTSSDAAGPKNGGVGYGGGMQGWWATDATAQGPAGARSLASAGHLISAASIMGTSNWSLAGAHSAASGGLLSTAAALAKARRGSAGSTGSGPGPSAGHGAGLSFLLACIAQAHAEKDASRAPSQTQPQARAVSGSGVLAQRPSGGRHSARPIHNPVQWGARPSPHRLAQNLSGSGSDLLARALPAVAEFVTARARVGPAAVCEGAEAVDAGTDTAGAEAGAGAATDDAAAAEGVRAGAGAASAGQAASLGVLSAPSSILLGDLLDTCFKIVEWGWLGAGAAGEPEPDSTASFQNNPVLGTGLSNSRPSGDGSVLATTRMSDQGLFNSTHGNDQQPQQQQAKMMPGVLVWRGLR